MKSFKNNNLKRKGKGIERTGRKQKAKYKAPFLAGRFSANGFYLSGIFRRKSTISLKFSSVEEQYCIRC